MTAHDVAARRIITALLIRQQELGYSHSRMSRELGISRPLWNMTLTGRKRVALHLLGGVFRRFPDLTPELLAFLWTLPPTPLTPQGGIGEPAKSNRTRDPHPTKGAT